ncbi:hypothetical protein SteCoe_20536 [Stentor coeruleus]|uniref:non-specific serine/threonine protein kinase n=1 Tax=Stentor coeruleus TaxID=5963 RepID=A0A1R2BS77_9CILI|nr:hypothetical protein SteCoe_20536 [Stentor coeruleus]
MGNCCIPEKSGQKNELKHNDPMGTSIRESKTITLNPGDLIQINTRPITNDYLLGETLGRGSFGEVCISTHKLTNSKKAAKIIYLNESNTKELDKLTHEVSILKLLDHPNIIKVFEIYKNKNKLYIITELFTGGELFDKIQKIKNFGENQAAKYMLDIVSAMMQCHDQNIIHRDLKPENLLFENNDQNAKLKLIDFGTSRFFTPENKLNKAIGTCYYMAPEILTTSYNKQVDVWSLGVILYIMLCGHVPFPGKNDQEIYSKIKGAPLSFSQQTWQGVSEEAKVLLRKMLDKNPNSRFTIEQVFNDNWLQSRGMGRVIDKQLEVSSLQNLISFRTHILLQTAIYTFIISQILDNTYFDKLKDMFMNIDKNNDGFLSNEEILKALESFNFKVSPEEIFKGYDTDKNGFINYSEFLNDLIHQQQTCNKRNLKNAFKRFDRNDGNINIQEIKELLGTSQSDSIVRKIVDEADININGVINFEEFVEHISRYSQEISENY